MLIFFAVLLAALLGIIAVFKRAVLFSLLVVYAVMPIRFWIDVDIGGSNLDTVLASCFIALLIARIFFQFRSIKFWLVCKISFTWIFLVIAFLSSFFMAFNSPVESFKMIIRLIYPCLVFFLVLIDFRTKDQIFKAIRSIWIVGVIVTAGVLIQSLIGGNLWKVSAGVNRFSGLGAISDYAYLMGIMAIVSHSIYRTKQGSLITCLFTLFFLAQVILTATRGAIFATFMGLMVFELFGMGKKALGKRSIYLILMIAVIGSATLFYEPLKQRMLSSNYNDSYQSDNLIDSFKRSFELSERQELWFAAISEIGANQIGTIFFGSGIGNSEIMAIKKDRNITHNEYVRVFYELGLIGLILFILSLWQMWKIIRREIVLNEFAQLNMVYGSALGILTLFIFGGGVDNMFNKYKLTGMMVYAFVGLTLCFKRAQKI